MRFALLNLEMLKNFGLNKVYVELAMHEEKFSGYYNHIYMSARGLGRNYLLCYVSLRGNAVIDAEDVVRSDRGSSGDTKKNELRAEGSYSLDVSEAQPHGGEYLRMYVIGFSYGAPFRVRYSSMAGPQPNERIGQLFPSEVQPLLLF